MKGYKKLLAGLIGIVMTLTGTLGCAGTVSNAETGTGSNTSKSQDTKGGEKATITYAIWDKNQEPGMQAIIDAFMEKNPDIIVKLEVTPWDQYWTKLEAAATGGAMPDVLWMHVNNFLKYQGSGMLMDITDQLKGSQEVDLANYPDGLVNLYVQDGKNYAIPKDYDTIGLWYNKTLFDEAGVAYPDETWDWNKLLEAAKRLTNTEKGIYGFSAPSDRQQGYWNWIYQNGGYVLSDDKTKSGFDQKATQEALQWWVDLSQKHKVSPTVQQFADTSFDEYFTSGKSAMGLFGSWMVSSFKANEYVKENCDVAVIPKGIKQATIYNGLGNVASAKTKYPEAASKFLEFMGTKEAHLLQAEYGAAIPAYNGCAEPWIESCSEFNVKAYPAMLDYGVVFMNSQTAPKWAEAEDLMMTKIFSGQISVEEGCNELAKEVNGILATETKK